jgi:hypothetical protein
MKTFLMGLIVLVLVSAGLSAPPPKGVASRPAGAATSGASSRTAADVDLDALVAELVKEADDLINDKKPSPELATKLKAYNVTDANVSAVIAAIETKRNDTADLYVTNSLLSRVLNARNEVIRQVLPVARKLQAQPANRYQDFPQLTPETIAGLKPPVASADNMAAMAKWQQRRDAKLAKDRKVALHNQQAQLLTKNVAAMTMIAGEDADDKALSKLMTNAEASGVTDYAVILGEIRGAAKDLAATRAEWWYNELKTIGERLKLTRKNYFNYAQPELDTNGPSKFKSDKDYAGIRILGTVNQLATAAKQPALTVPTDKEVDDAISKAAAAKTTSGTKAPTGNKPGGK